MKATEIAIKENLGKRYKNQKGREFILEKFICSEGDFFELVCAKSGLIFTNEFHLSEIASMEFEEIADWSEIPVDTKVLVSNDGENWYKRHFAKYKDGKFLAWEDGTTSFTAIDESDYFPWKYAKIYQE